MIRFSYAISWCLCIDTLICNIKLLQFSFFLSDMLPKFSIFSNSVHKATSFYYKVSPVLKKLEDIFENFINIYNMQYLRLTNKKYPSTCIYLPIYTCIIKIKKDKTDFSEIMHQKKLMKKLHSVIIYILMYFLCTSFGSSNCI